MDYPEELTKIEDFLTRFVPDTSRRNRQLPDDDDEEAEEEDLANDLDELDVDEDDDAPGGERRSKAKYMKVLRRIANRRSAAVTIDLNDVKEVSLTRVSHDESPKCQQS